MVTRLATRLQLKLTTSRWFNSASTVRETARPIVWKHIKHLVPYSDAYELQHKLIQHKINDPIDSLDWLLLLEHEPIYTTGRRQSEEEISSHTRELLLDHHPQGSKPGIFHTLRGGQLTFHGPGQLVGYPILNLKSINLSARMYVDLLMNVVRTTLTHPILPMPIESVDPKENRSLPIGIFIDNDEHKIASIGVQIKRRMTCHGFALNVTEESQIGFRSIVACGLKNTRMTSIHSVLKQKQETAGINSSIPAYNSLNVVDLILPTVEVFGKLTGRVMKEMDSSCQELDPVGYQLVEQFVNSNPSI